MTIDRISQSVPFASAENLRERLRAETLLAKMDAFEVFAPHLATGAEGLPPLESVWEGKMVEVYERAIGVAPGRRDALRDKLQAIRDFGRGRVVDILTEFAARRGEL